MPTSEHILELDQTTGHGKVYIIGDVHGEIEAFNEVLADLTPDDTLIIAGDLIDRGDRYDPETNETFPTSNQILDTLIQHTAAPQGSMPKILAIRGNHEQYFLQMLSMIDTFQHLKNRNTVPVEYIKNMSVFLSNGGGWIFHRPDSHPQQAERARLFLDFGSSDEFSSADLAKVYAFIKAFIITSDHYAELDPKIHRYRDYIASLPFLIKVNGANPVLIVHADLPFSDEEIEACIREGGKFEPFDIQHMTAARCDKFLEPGKRNHLSKLVVVGHNIIDEPGARLSHPAVPFRADTNHINLDAGAFFTKSFLRFNLTDNYVSIVGSELSDKDRPLLEYALNEINMHLQRLAGVTFCEDWASEQTTTFGAMR